MVTYDSLVEAVIKGDENVIVSEVTKALSEKTDPRDVLTKGLIAGMSVVGERFRAGEMFLPEVLMSAKAMHSGLDIVKPLLAESGQQVLGRVVIGTVAGDIHDIGKRIVSLLLEGNGFEVIDLGVNVKDEAFAKAVQEHQPDVVCMSALLTTTMPNMRSAIDLLKKKGLRNKVRIIVGGASVTEEFAHSIEADGYGRDASSGVEWVKKTIAKS